MYATCYAVQPPRRHMSLTYLSKPYSRKLVTTTSTLPSAEIPAVGRLSSTNTFQPPPNTTRTPLSGRPQHTFRRAGAVHTSSCARLWRREASRDSQPPYPPAGPSVAGTTATAAVAAAAAAPVGWCAGAAAAAATTPAYGAAATMLASRGRAADGTDPPASHRCSRPPERWGGDQPRPYAIFFRDP